MCKVVKMKRHDGTERLWWWCGGADIGAVAGRSKNTDSTGTVRDMHSKIPKPYA